MRITKEQMPVVLEAGPSSVRAVEWGDMRVSLVAVPAGTDFGPLLKGLPNDRCQGPHWGWIVRGRLRIQYPSSEEVLSAGDFYYMPPDHTGVAEEDTEFIEVVPAGLHQAFLEAARRNIEAMQAAAGSAAAQQE